MDHSTTQTFNQVYPQYQIPYPSDYLMNTDFSHDINSIMTPVSHINTSTADTLSPYIPTTSTGVQYAPLQMYDPVHGHNFNDFNAIATGMIANTNTTGQIIPDTTNTNKMDSSSSSTSSSSHNNNNSSINSSTNNNSNNIETDYVQNLSNELQHTKHLLKQYQVRTEQLMELVQKQTNRISELRGQLEKQST
ncbi:hypothetical protein BDB01DRAFT_778280 [Pilobolus umbonatus]|nr:hypothetical protein BDB01DRAFT_778280 [Pilobolus umbonatus]